MSGLLSSLSYAASALNAHRMGLDVVGQNMANVNTAGYTRRTLLLAETASADPYNVGRGVEVLGVRATRDRFIESRLNLEQQAAAYADARIRQLQVFQAGLGAPGAGLDARLTAYFDAFQTLSNDVTSPAAREVVVAEGRALARAFNDQAARLVELQRRADGEVRAAVDEINTLAAQIAELNGKITHAVAIDLEALKDQRNVKIARLAELAGATAVERGDGPIDVVIGPGQALVVGAQAFRVDVTSSGPQQLAALSVSGTDITNQLRGGQLAALTDVRDVTVPGYQAALDQLAWGVATQVNGLHAAGFDLSGAPAGNFFTVPGSAAGAAAAIAVDAAVAANSALVAGSLTGAVGDNQTARAIAALRDTRFLAGGTATATEAWGQLVYQVGAHLASAQSDSATYGQVVRQLQRLRDSTSGVSLDEEAAMLMKYQRAYEANARYFLTISDTLDTLLGMVR